MATTTLKTNEWLRQREVDELLAYVRKRASRKKAPDRAKMRRLIIELGLFAGLRASEMAALNVRHLPVYHGSLSIEIIRGKRSKDRVVPIPIELARLLWSYVTDVRGLLPPVDEKLEPLLWPYLKGDDEAIGQMTQRQRRQLGDYLVSVRAAGPEILDAPLLVGKTGRRIRRHTIWSSISLVGVALGYEAPDGPRPEHSDRNTLYPHRLRHTYAVRLALNDTHIAVIAQYLGHSDVNMTMVYLRTAQAYAGREAEKIWC